MRVNRRQPIMMNSYAKHLHCPMSWWQTEGQVRKTCQGCFLGCFRGHSRGYFRGGYTLVEVTACLLIAGLLAGIASVSLRGAAATLTVDDAMEQLEHLDRHARSRARINGRSHWIDVDLKQHRLRLMDPTPDGVIMVMEVVFPKDSASSVLLAPHTDVGSPLASETSESDSSRLRLTFSPQGISASYAIGLRHQPTNQERWLIVAGMTGHTRHQEGGASHVTQRLTLLREAGHDTR